MRKNKDKNFKQKRASFPIISTSLYPLIEMASNREISIEGVKGVLEYDDNVIRINSGNMIISFFGRGLVMQCLTSSSLVIKGFITKIEFLS